MRKSHTNNLLHLSLILWISFIEYMILGFLVNYPRPKGHGLVTAQS